MRPQRYRRLKAVLERRQPDLTVLMERVNKLHNLAAILRNCDAVGVLEAHAVLAERPLALDPHTSAGTQKWVPVHTYESVEDAVGRIRADGFTVVAAQPGNDATDFRDLDFTEPIAIMVGAELHGISPEGLALADHRVVIPMTGMARSLNVSVATSLMLYEAFRQREVAGMYARPRINDAERARLLFQWAYPRIATRLDGIGAHYPALSEDGALIGSIPGTVRPG
jgi:tRNA (guanosine-2'-O-)-methyltransferase